MAVLPDKRAGAHTSHVLWASHQIARHRFHDPDKLVRRQVVDYLLDAARPLDGQLINDVIGTEPEVNALVILREPMDAS